MRLRVVDGNDVQPHRQSNLISYVVNDQIGLDAGALGLMPLEDQKKIRAIFLSHVHADHIATLPLLIDNVYQSQVQCLELYANAETIADLRSHVFNDRIWPDIVRLGQERPPFIQFQEVVHGQAVQLLGVTVTAFAVDHTLPTLGFVVDDSHSAVAVVADTADCPEIWTFLQRFERLKAVFLEISFPDSMRWLADVSKHLTPSDFVKQTEYLQRSVQWFVTHTKPGFSEVIAKQLQDLHMPHCQFALSSHEYDF